MFILHYLDKFRVFALLVVAIGLVIFGMNAPASAQTEAECFRDAIEKTEFTFTTPCDVPNLDCESVDVPIVASPVVYVLGDTIGVGMQQLGDFVTVAARNNWTIAGGRSDDGSYPGINVASGRTLSEATSTIEADIGVIPQAKTAVVSLGTFVGSGEETVADQYINKRASNQKTDFETKVEEIGTILFERGVNQIVWIDNASLENPTLGTERNKILYNYAGRTEGVDMVSLYDLLYTAGAPDAMDENAASSSSYASIGDGTEVPEAAYADLNTRIFEVINNNNTADETRTEIVCTCGAGSPGIATGAAVDGTTEDYVATYGNAAYEVGRLNGIPYDAILAHSAIESGRGQSKLTTEANNFFGIKAGDSWTGAVYSIASREVINGQESFPVSNFRAYATPEESFQDYARLIRTSNNYKDALEFPDDPIEYFKKLLDKDEPGENAYATDPDYVRIFTSVLRSVQEYISENNLFEPSSEVPFDVQPLTSDINNLSISSKKNCSGGTAGNIEFDQLISFTGRPINPEAIVLHWTGGNPNATPQDLVNVLNNRGLSVQLFADGDGKVWQLTDPLATRTGHACGANGKAIGIEIAGRGESDLLNNDVQKQAVINAVVKLTQLYPSINAFETSPTEVSGIYGHIESDVFFPCDSGPSGKPDPGREYLELIRESVREAIRNGNTGGCPAGVSKNAPYQEHCATLSQLINANQSSFNQLKTSAEQAGRLLKQSDATPIGITSVADDIYDSYLRLLDGAKEDGVTLEPVSGFRTYEDQALQRIEFCSAGQTDTSFGRIFEGTTRDCTIPVARPGTSQHNQGKALDFGINGVTDQCSYENTPAYAWLSENADDFGFETIGLSSRCGGGGGREPWHWEPK